MASEYLYGAYGHLAESVAKSAMQTSTASVYFGTAPVNLVREYKDSGGINVPIKVSNLPDAQRKLGYSADWASFTLCEAMAAHFDNPIGNIGPVYMINVLDPDIHRKSADTTTSLNFVGGRSEIKSDAIILDTLVLEDKMEGVDFQIDYNFTRAVMVISSVNASEPITGTVLATYREVDAAMVDEQAIIGTNKPETGEYTGIGAVNLIYPKMNVIPNLLAAPGWSEFPAVYEELTAAAKKINGHWDDMVAADIPINDGTAVDTITKALTWKKQKGYSDENAKVCWPRVKDKQGRVFHLSTFAVVEFMRTDSNHSSVPMETCANKPIPAMQQYFGEDTTNKGFDQQTGNLLAQNGITTAVAWAGQWVLWGDHTAAYSFDTDMDPRVIFDVSMRMLYHITNSFQSEWANTIDRPMTRAVRDSILNREQEKLDALVGMGALIGDSRVLFLESENPTSEMIEGRFRWDIPVTTAPPLKAASVYVAYTTEGFEGFFEEGE